MNPDADPDPCNADDPDDPNDDDDVEDGFCLRPSNLIADEVNGGSLGFYHEVYVSGPPVPEEFANRPWVVTTEVNYCFDTEAGCSTADGSSFVFGVIMVPDRG